VLPSACAYSPSLTHRFLVENLDDGETLEIANIGSGVVSVVNSRPHNAITNQPAVSRAVASNLHSQKLVCRINLDHEGTAASSASSSASVENDHENDHEEHFDTNAAASLVQTALSPLPLPALFNIPCAVSGFGRSLDAEPSPPVSGTMHFSSTDPKGCTDPLRTSPSSPPSTAAAAAAAPEPSGPHSWIFPRPSAPPPSSSTQQETSNESGTVSVVQRGDCMFEHKARVAEQKGAAAVVVVNSEYGQKFIMSGQTITAPTLIPNPVQPSKQDEEGTAEDVAGSANTAVNSDAAVDDAVPAPAPVGIPVVMVAREHGELLEAAQERLAAKGFTPKLTVHVDKHPRPGSSSSGSDRRDTDEYTWPTVVVAANSLQVLGMGEWGAFLSSPSGKEWQLFVTKKQATPASTTENSGSSTVPVE